MVAETFSPAVNGVVNSVRAVAGELRARGHEVTVIAPSGEPFQTAAGVVPVLRVPSIALPGYRDLPLGRPGLDLRRTLFELTPDVVHLASPALLGQAGARAARALDVPAVAVFQTDVAAFIGRYAAAVGVPRAVRTRVTAAAWYWLRQIHREAALTLAPSRTTMSQLRAQSIGPLALWPRGVDLRRFHPLRRDQKCRQQLLQGRRLLVGVVARLATEKRHSLLAAVAAHPELRLVVIGDGPLRSRLPRLLPDAVFVGQRTGSELGRMVASLDVVVHAGADETFCQSVQEGLAAGVPAVVRAAGGPLDLVRHDVNGLLWHDDDPDTLRALVASLVDDRHRHRLASAARPSVASRSWGRITEQLLGYYAGVSARAPQWPTAGWPGQNTA